jgi:hypothetical protein
MHGQLVTQREFQIHMAVQHGGKFVYTRNLTAETSPKWHGHYAVPNPPWACHWDICFNEGVTFDDEAEYAHHMDLHAKHGALIHACESCAGNIRFETEQLLRSHVIRIHERRFEHMCEYCGTGFHTSAECFSHWRDKHRFDRPLHRSEDLLAHALLAAGIPFERERRVAHRRVDFVVKANGEVVYIENDENQHRNNTPAEEVARMLEIDQGSNPAAGVFIRFNPDPFRVNGEWQKLPLYRRHEHLVQTLQNPKHAIYDKSRPIQVLHMYYDTSHGVPTVVQHYGALVDAVMPCVIDLPRAAEPA